MSSMSHGHKARGKAIPPDLVSGQLSPKNQAWLAAQQDKTRKAKAPADLQTRVEQLERQVAWLTTQLRLVVEVTR